MDPPRLALAIAYLRKVEEFNDTSRKLNRLRNELRSLEEKNPWMVPLLSVVDGKLDFVPNQPPQSGASQTGGPPVLPSDPQPQPPGISLPSPAIGVPSKTTLRKRVKRKLKRISSTQIPPFPLSRNQRRLNPPSGPMVLSLERPKEKEKELSKENVE